MAKAYEARQIGVARNSHYNRNHDLNSEVGKCVLHSMFLKVVIVGLWSFSERKYGFQYVSILVMYRTQTLYGQYHVWTHYCYRVLLLCNGGLRREHRRFCLYTTAQEKAFTTVWHALQQDGKPMLWQLEITKNNGDL